jgi:vacuolar protein sorting-associated protein 13A/C
VIVNSCGRELTLTLGECKNFILSQDVESSSMDKACQVPIPSGTEKALRLKLNKNFHERAAAAAAQKAGRTSAYVSPLVLQSEESEATLRLRVAGESAVFNIPISKTDQRFFPFSGGGATAQTGFEHGFVSHVVVENLRKIITIKSLVTWKNYYPDAAVRIWQEIEGRFVQLATLGKGEEWNAPLSAVYGASGGALYLSLEGPGQNMGLEPISWKDIEPAGHCRKVVECSNTRGEPSVYLNVEGCATDIFRETSRELTSRNYVISIRPLVLLKNCLPVPLFYSCGNQARFRALQEGESGCLEELRHGQTLIRLRLDGEKNNDDSNSNAGGGLACNKVFDENMKQLELWRFEAFDAVASAQRMDLGVQKEVSKGTTVLALFAPFWFVNKTGRTLRFRGHDTAQELVHRPEAADRPLMFSYITKSLFGKKKVSMRVDDSGTLWSDPFTVDTIGDMGKVSCKLEPERRASLQRNNLLETGGGKKSIKNNSSSNNSKHDDAYHIGIQISQSTASLTKIVTFTPYIVAYNAAEFGIELKEAEMAEEAETNNGGWLLVPSRECLPLWPLCGGRNYICRVAGTTETTVPFSVLDPNPSLLMLANKYGGLDVRCKLDTAQVLVTLAGYRPGAAPVLLINHTATWHLEVGEVGSKSSKRILAPGKKCLYTWERPSGGSRTLVWSIQGAFLYN